MIIDYKGNSQDARRINLPEELANIFLFFGKSIARLFMRDVKDLFSPSNKGIFSTAMFFLSTNCLRINMIEIPFLKLGGTLSFHI